MKPHHGAVLALVGWYLALAPIDQKNPQVIDENAPLATWVRIAAPDGEMCESWVKTSRTIGADPSTESPKVGNSRTLTSSQFRKRLFTSQCIASDDGN
jgi:hypothetical protein